MWSASTWDQNRWYSAKILWSEHSDFFTKQTRPNIGSQHLFPDCTVKNGFRIITKKDVAKCHMMYGSQHWKPETWVDLVNKRWTDGQFSVSIVPPLSLQQQVSGYIYPGANGVGTRQVWLWTCTPLSVTHLFETPQRNKKERMSRSISVRLHLHTWFIHVALRLPWR